MKKPIIIVGTGGFAKEVFALLYDLNMSDAVMAFVEKEVDPLEPTFLGKPIKKESELDLSDFRVVVAVSSPQIREKIVKKYPVDTDYPSLVHPSVVSSPWVQVGKGTLICAGCILTHGIQLGDHVHLNLQTTVGHDAHLAAYVTTAPGVHINGQCRIGEGVYLGTAAATRQGITIKAGIVVGMGAMVVKDLTEPGTYVGVPARRMEAR